MSRHSTAATLALCLLATGCAYGSAAGQPAEPESTTVAREDAQGWAAPPVNASFDYQIGGEYPLPEDVTVVSRDWYYGSVPQDVYGICYVNAFQTQPDWSGTRPDELSNWPSHLVLLELGDDPNWGGEYLVDISTEGNRIDAVEHLRPMLETCADKGFSAVEFDNLDSWMRFDGTPVEELVPFGQDEAVDFAARLTEVTHDLGMAAAQKNTVELPRAVSLEEIGFDFAIAENCGMWRECQLYRQVFGDNLIAIEYERQHFESTCAEIGDSVSVVLRDVNVTPPGSPTYQYDSC
ncbi:MULTISPECIES: endo alpha-1,4 polygalactosaminidase [Actinoalloteichus]|uniref:Glycoside-hydrolase family GH114 n=1 Tax=Actinoalloteichus caeruleus DSM 43889 TaxID=1120930 RepID=A0ABT1JPQ0_ACTCY|nr:MULTISPECIES: endo alpha-1,4 polygalactosaminidase [Actinoalloteichus]MCP2334111.1 Glycoside-hydrolase family GH114 [Actinoalloteichus caeruleus DSM 43889]